MSGSIMFIDIWFSLMPWYLTVFDALTSDSVLCLDIWFSLCVDNQFTSDSACFSPMHWYQIQSDSVQCLDISFSPQHWHLGKSYTLTTGLILCTDIRFNFMHWYMIQSYALINVWCIVIWVSLVHWYLAHDRPTYRYLVQSLTMTTGSDLNHILVQGQLVQSGLWVWVIH